MAMPIRINKTKRPPGRASGKGLNLILEKYYLRGYICFYAFNVLSLVQRICAIALRSHISGGMNNLVFSQNSCIYQHHQANRDKPLCSDYEN